MFICWMYFCLLLIAIASDSSSMQFVSSNRGRFSHYITQISQSSVLSTCPQSKVKIIGTHDGGFHCDEALASSLLKLHPLFSDGLVVRSRNPDILKDCDIVVDVGGIYDPITNRYDHHQREFKGVLEELGFSTKLSSAGLVYKHFGKDILVSLLSSNDVDISPDDRLIEILYKKVYKDFIEHIDGIDNGVTVSDSPLKYFISSTLSNRVGRLNPSWNEEQSNDIINSRFRDAMVLTGSEFLSLVYELAYSWWPARSIVKDALDKRMGIDSSGKVVILEQYCPWKDHLFELEAELGAAPVLYVLYPDSSGQWRIQAVPEDTHSFASRKGLPDSWRGLRDDTLSQICGVSGAVFVHASGFIGGHRTREGALSMALQAVSLGGEESESVLGKHNLA